MKRLYLLLFVILGIGAFNATLPCNVGHFDVILKSVVNNEANCTSTWTYQIKGYGSGPSQKDLSHWVLPLCEGHEVLTANFDWEVVLDPTLGIYGIKWDKAVPKNGTETFTVTLNGIYSQTSVRVGVKAGQSLLYGNANGPSCTSLCTAKPVQPILECVQPNGNGTYTAYFGYLNENSQVISIPKGLKNYFSPAPEDRGQLVEFQSGRSSYYPDAAFSVVFDGNEIVWTLVGPDGVTRTASASKDDERCESVKPASIGNKVWLDTDKDGIQDNDENGFVGVTVKLYNCLEAELASVLTDENGNYLFTNLTPGDYYIQFILPDNYSFSPKNASDEDSDSDADIVTGKTVCTTLDEDEQDLTWDAGIHVTFVPEESDLSLLKEVDNNSPKDGDEVLFTLTVTNNGPDRATGVKVSDLLPEGLNFISAEPAGQYNETTGIWSIGEIESGESISLTIKVKVETIDMHNSTFDLGIAKDFNLFIFEDALMPSSDTQGRMAVGRNASLANYSVGDQLNGAADVLIVGGHLQFTSGAVYNGNVVYGNSTNLPIYAVSIAGELVQANPIDFSSARNYLTNLSSQLSNYTVNGTTVFEWGGLNLTGSDPFLNVFTVNGSELSSANNMNISVPNGSVVLVNISGNSVNWTGGLTVTGTEITNVLYNFYEAELLSIQGIDVTGSILAPLAHVNFVSGVQNGQMIAKSLEGMGQFNYSHFLGNIPQETTIKNIAEVSSSDQPDPDSTPGNGVESEDDYSSVTVTVNGNNEGNSEGNNNDDNTGNWEYVGDFSLDEMIWSLTLDNSSNLLAGTVGGKIYKSNDNGLTWERINEEMNVSWIWSLKVNANGYILAGTEQGIYGSQDGSSWSLIGLAGKDIRSIVLDNSGNIYAGTWGFGVYKSENNGGNWAEVNTNLSCSAVHSLAINSNSDVFAGTFGGGIYKLSNGDNSWTQLNCGYSFIWALGITSDNKIYAGTYGNGVLFSANGGTTFEQLNNGLATQFVYSISIDVSDNVYLNTWAGGIYGLSSANNTWFAAGMAGEGVSSITTGLSSQSLYVGTSSGRIYKNSAALTTVENKIEGTPTEYILKQNYPNPFNPSTIIEFGISAAGFYNLKIYNSIGEEISTILSENLETGNYRINFNAEHLTSGIYFYRLSGDNVNISRKMILIR